MIKMHVGEWIRQWKYARYQCHEIFSIGEYESQFLDKYENVVNIY